MSWRRSIIIDGNLSTEQYLRIFLHAGTSIEKAFVWHIFSFILHRFFHSRLFVPLEVLFEGCFVSGCFVSGRFTSGRFVSGRYVSGSFV
jgi:hypothetical protein